MKPRKPQGKKNIYLYKGCNTDERKAFPLVYNYGKRFAGRIVIHYKHQVAAIVGIGIVGFVVLIVVYGIYVVIGIVAVVGAQLRQAAVFVIIAVGNIFNNIFFYTVVKFTDRNPVGRYFIAL